MSSELAVRTNADIVRSVAWREGVEVLPTDREALDILWNHTGFPSFFLGEPIACVELQLTEMYVMAKFGCQPCIRCGWWAPKSGMCAQCDERLREELGDDE